MSPTFFAFALLCAFVYAIYVLYAFKRKLSFCCLLRKPSDQDFTVFQSQIFEFHGPGTGLSLGMLG